MHALCPETCVLGYERGLPRPSEPRAGSWHLLTTRGTGYHADHPAHRQGAPCQTRTCRSGVHRPPSANDAPSAVAGTAAPLRALAPA